MHYDVRDVGAQRAVAEPPFGFDTLHQTGHVAEATVCTGCFESLVLCQKAQRVGGSELEFAVVSHVVMGVWHRDVTL